MKKILRPGSSITDARRTDAKRGGLRPAPMVDHGDYRAKIPPTVEDQDFPRLVSEDGLRKQRADFRPEMFTAALQQKGRYVLWRKAIQCPCWNDVTDQTEINCLDCDGSGYVYVDPLRIQAWVTNFDQRLDLFKHAGQWLSGEGSITVLPEHRCAYRDSIELLDDVMPYNEMLRRNDRHGVRSKLPDGHDAARYRIQQAVRLAYRDPTTKRVRLAEQDVHFAIDDNGWIRWLPGSDALITPGTMFSLLYNFHPVYLVTSYGNSNRADQIIFAQPKNTLVGLPLRALIKLDFLVDVNAVTASGSISDPLHVSGDPTAEP